jgi:hypothetical protein
VTCISTKIEDGGHFIPYDQNICRSKQDNMKKWLKNEWERVNEKIKIYIAISL